MNKFASVEDSYDDILNGLNKLSKHLSNSIQPEQLISNISILTLGEYDLRKVIPTITPKNTIHQFSYAMTKTLELRVPRGFSLRGAVKSTRNPVWIYDRGACVPFQSLIVERD
mgnify:FL=1